MKKRRRMMFWILLFVFVALSAWWCLYFPYRQTDLYRAVPRGAVLISEHENLAGRWAEITTNPLAGAILRASGMEQEDIEAMADGPGTRALLDMLASRHTVFAHLPYAGRRGKPAWVGASWVGTYGQFMRWGFFRGLLSDFESETIGGQRVWRLPGEEDSDPQLFLAVNEGVLLASYTRDPDIILLLCERLRESRPIVPALAEGGFAVSDPAPDRGWVSWYDRSGIVPLKKTARWALTTCNAEGTRGWVRGELGIPAPDPTSPAVSPLTEGLGGLLGDFPDLLAVANYRDLDIILRRLPVPGLAAVLDELTAAGVDGGRALACLAGGERSGSIMGLTVPTLLVGVEVRDGNAVLGRVPGLLDRLNADHGWGMIPRRKPAPGGELIVLDTSRKGLYGVLGKDSKPALAARADWLLLGSNTDVLGAFVAGSGQETAGPSFDGRLLDADARAFVWVDLDATGQGLKKALAVGSFAVAVQGGENSAALRAQLADAMVWIDFVRPLGELTLSLRSEDTEQVISFRLAAANTAKATVSEKP